MTVIITIAFIYGGDPHSQSNKSNESSGREPHRVYGIELHKGFCMGESM